MNSKAFTLQKTKPQECTLELRSYVIYIENNCPKLKLTLAILYYSFSSLFILLIHNTNVPIHIFFIHLRYHIMIIIKQPLLNAPNVSFPLFINAQIPKENRIKNCLYAVFKQSTYFQNFENKFFPTSKKPSCTIHSYFPLHNASLSLFRNVHTGLPYTYSQPIHVHQFNPLARPKEIG